MRTPKHHPLRFSFGKKVRIVVVFFKYTLFDFARQIRTSKRTDFCAWKTLVGARAKFFKTRAGKGGARGQNKNFPALFTSGINGGFGADNRNSVFFSQIFHANGGCRTARADCRRNNKILLLGLFFYIRLKRLIHRFHCRKTLRHPLKRSLQPLF